MRSIIAIAACLVFSASADLHCNITNVTAGVLMIKQHGTTHYGGHSSCSYTFSGKVSAVRKIEGNHCDACTPEGNYSVACACKCKSVTCDFEMTSEVDVGNATGPAAGVCHCSH